MKSALAGMQAAGGGEFGGRWSEYGSPHGVVDFEPAGARRGRNLR